MSANVSVVSLDVLGKDGTFTVEKIDAWLQHALQIVINHPDLEVKVLTQGLYPGVGEALVGLVVAAGLPAPALVYPAHLHPEARHTSAAGRAFRDWQIQWLNDVRNALAGDNTLELFEAIGKVIWEDLDHDSPVHTRSEMANHMVKMHKLISKYSSAYSAANPKQVCDKCIWTLPTKQMQRLAVDSRGPDPAAAANDTFSAMFRRLTEAAVLAERAGPALTGLRRNKKSVRKLSETDLEPEKKARPEKAAETARTQPPVTTSSSQDRVLVCLNCKQNFDFTARDQQFFATKGFSDPKRCKSCRDKADADRKANDPRLQKP